MNRNLLSVYLIIFCLCFICVPTPAQTKVAVKDKQLNEKVDSFVREKMAANHIPGLSLAVVRDGKIILAKGYGMANLELSTAANEKTAFAIYSVTKPFTAMATMMLVEDGKISLEDPISKHIVDLPAAWNSVTVRQLLNHTSGIKSFQESSFKPFDLTRDHTQMEIINLTASSPLDFPSGEGSEYNNRAIFCSEC